MKRSIFVALGTGAVISSAAAISIGASAKPEAGPMSRQQYESELQKVESSRAAAVVRCGAMDSAYERDLCRTEAAAGEMIRVAEIENGYRRTQQAARSLQRARIDGRYQVERVRCNALGGYRRDKCLIQAHAVKGRAMLDAAAPYEVRF